MKQELAVPKKDLRQSGDSTAHKSESRVLCWFSCGAASAVAAKLAIEKYGNRCEVLYCDTLAYEHPDNRRFLSDCEKWFDREVKLLQSTEYTDIFDVFKKTRWLVGTAGARCTTELKKNVRLAYQRPSDLHVMGYVWGESDRIKKLKANSIGENFEFILHDKRLSKRHCLAAIQDAGIELPTMYQLGYNNNNCIGCVKGQQGYWNKIRVDFPDAFDRMARMERELNAAINKVYVNGERIRVFLDEMDPHIGNHDEEPPMDCGVLCQVEMDL